MPASPPAAMALKGAGSTQLPPAMPSREGDELDDDDIDGIVGHADAFGASSEGYSQQALGAAVLAAMGFACLVGWQLRRSRGARESRKRLPLVMGEDEEEDGEMDDETGDLEQPLPENDDGNGVKSQRAGGKTKHVKDSKAEAKRGRRKGQLRADDDEEHRAFLALNKKAEDAETHVPAEPSAASNSRPGTTRRPPPSALLDDDDDIYVPLRPSMD